MLNQYISDKKPKQQPLRRPYLASQCRDLPKADKWRQQVMQEIGRKVLEIQNEGLGEHCLRDMNNEINKLIREKSHWEKRIVEVGGPNYMKHNIVGSSKSDGRGPGYIYFGATKKLPGVSMKGRPYKPTYSPQIPNSFNPFLIWFGPAQEEEESGEEFVVHVSLPDEKEIERMVVRRKMELLKRYVSEDLMEEQREVKAMLNIQRFPYQKISKDTDEGSINHSADIVQYTSKLSPVLAVRT
ncbi:Pre-mRNA-splicing factor ISY1 -like protein [Capsicum annuum]|uniref:Pre-mRNA-splicing factor ISY1 -like protein n=1 Tax=Capsicum annuum TaxID=4072 RepID=A0A2G2YCI0_CAPAN|nr:Pre-mRNA-splicing factor ISY1 -like protein [Capsicum annuum]